MKLQHLERFLLGQPYAQFNQSETHISFRCPECGDSRKNQDTVHFGVKVAVEDGEAIVYHCFQPMCKAGGVIKTDFLIKKLSCHDMQVLLEVSKHNATISKNFDKKVDFKYKKNYSVVNLNNKRNSNKLDYINKRLGLSLTTSDLKKYKIQLGIMEYLRINSINKLNFPLKTLELMDRSCVGFISCYDDYVILRDCSEELVTGRRYTNYRIGKPNEGESKIYVIPTEIDIITPEPAVIHVAEGIMSILGAYHHTNIDREYRNQLFAANNGTGYIHTVSHLCRQYGLVDAIVHVYSDSEIKLKAYNDLLVTLRENLNIRKLVIHYNKKKEDFGHKESDIKVESTTLYEENKRGGIIRL